MPKYFVVIHNKSCPDGDVVIENSVISEHPLKHLAGLRKVESIPPWEVNLLWWTEVTDAAAKVFEEEE